MEHLALSHLESPAQVNEHPLPQTLFCGKTCSISISILLSKNQTMWNKLPDRLQTFNPITNVSWLIALHLPKLPLSPVTICSPPPPAFLVALYYHRGQWTCPPPSPPHSPARTCLSLLPRWSCRHWRWRTTCPPPHPHTCPAAWGTPPSQYRDRDYESYDGGPHARFCERLAFHSAPHRHQFSRHFRRF